MEQVLIFATIVSPIILALVELIKKTMVIKVNYIPAIALFIGLTVGFLAYPFTDLAMDLRLWAGAIGGLAATGLFELGSKRTGETKADWTNGK